MATKNYMVRGFDLSFIKDVCDPCEFFDSEDDAIEWAKDYMQECGNDWLELQIYAKAITLGAWQMIGVVTSDYEFEECFC